jgi:hypothetical protein
MKTILFVNKFNHFWDRKWRIHSLDEHWQLWEIMELTLQAIN